MAVVIMTTRMARDPEGAHFQQLLHCVLHTPAGQRLATGNNSICALKSVGLINKANNLQVMAKETYWTAVLALTVNSNVQS